MSNGHSSIIYTKGFITVDRAGPIAGMGVFFGAEHFRAASYQWAQRGGIAENELRAEITAMIGGLSRLLKGFMGHKIILVTDNREAYEVVGREIEDHSAGLPPYHTDDPPLYAELHYELDDRNVEIHLSTGVAVYQAGMNRARTQAIAAIEACEQ
ncbi:unnamed protein product [Parajaminaea phylloscopi]